jgi:hypothetical protein
MAKVIWKYPIPYRGHFEIIMPEGARILKVAFQRREPFMWVLADSAAKEEKRKFFLAGTGEQPYDETGQYIDTFLINNDSLVLHLFDITNTG